MSTESWEFQQVGDRETFEANKTATAQVAKGDADKKEPVKFGEKRMTRFRETADEYGVDYDIGCQKVTYLSEADKRFFKVAFVTDGEAIYMVDVYQ